VSTILVMGGSGDYFECADLVLSMDCYRPQDVTAIAKKVAARYKPPGAAEVLGQGGAAAAAGVHPLVVTPRVPSVVCPNGDSGEEDRP
jgi:predicted ABC-class ATPase